MHWYVRVFDDYILQKQNWCNPLHECTLTVLLVSFHNMAQFQRRSMVPVVDPFLERFTVTGRAILDEHAQDVWYCEDIFGRR